MARQEVDIGVEGNDGTGDSIRESFRKVNENFREIYAVVGKGGQITFTLLSDTPDDLAPYAGDGNIAYVPMVSQDGTVIEVRQIGSNELDETDNDDDTIEIKVSQDGALILKTKNLKLSQDPAPVLGGPLNGGTVAIANIGTSQTDIEDFNNVHGTSLTVDDLAIDKKFADQNYIPRQIPGEYVGVTSEPENADTYTKTFTVSNNFALMPAHGFTKGSNGKKYILKTTGAGLNWNYIIRNPLTDEPITRASTDAEFSPLQDGDEVYINIKDSNRLEFYIEKDYADEEDDLTREELRLKITTIDAASLAIVDADYDDSLEGFFLSSQVMPRNSVVRRQGDEMEGTLILNDHPGDLAGYEGPGGITDRQAVTKLYVDSQSTESSANIYVSTQGDDDQSVAPPGKEGSSLAYAFRTVGAAARKAEQIQIASPFEPGPYMQDIVYSRVEVEGEPAVVKKSQATTFGVITDAGLGSRENAYDIVRANIDFIIEETLEWVRQRIAAGDTTNVGTETGTVSVNWKDRTFDERALELELRRAINAAILDHVAGATATTLSTRVAAEFFNSEYEKAQQGITTDVYVSVLDRAKSVTANVVTNDSNVPFDSLQSIYDQTFINFVDATDSADVASIAGDNGNLSLQIDIVNAGVFSIRENSNIRARANVVGNRYRLNFSNGLNDYVDQGNPQNTDLRIGKVIRGKTSGAIGKIVSYTQGGNNDDEAELELLRPVEFIQGENLEYGNTVNERQITIHIETGQYEEDYPIRLPAQTSLVGNEMRRTIIRPKKRVSQSPWSGIYFYRDREFDGLTGDDTSVTGIGDPNLPTSGTAYYDPLKNLTPGVDDPTGYFGRHYLYNPSERKNINNNGLLAYDNPGFYTQSAILIERNKSFIVEETIAFIDERVDRDTPPNGYIITWTDTERDRYRKQLGIVLDLMAKDLREGDDLGVLEAQGEIFFDSKENPGEEIVGEQSLTYINLILNDVLANQTFNRPSDIDAYILGNHPDQYVNSNLTTPAEVLGLEGIKSKQINLLKFAYNENCNPAKRSTDLDVFLMNDATIVRQMSITGHGGFMSVLDPEGQILTKSPYIQTGSSFSQSLNRQAFRGGMLVDAFCANTPLTVTNTNGAFELEVKGDVGSGLAERKPQTPAPFYINGIRYQVDDIIDYDDGGLLGEPTATLVLNPSSGPTNDIDPALNDGWQIPLPVGGYDITLQTAGNRSQLGNDFTQVNDLGYGLVTINGGLSEMVSMFTYYCHGAYYAGNGGQIRSTNGSNCNGVYGLIAEGSDPNEVPDAVVLDNDMTQSAKAFSAAIVLELPSVLDLTGFATDTIIANSASNPTGYGKIVFKSKGKKVYLYDVRGTFSQGNDVFTGLTFTDYEDPQTGTGGTDSGINVDLVDSNNYTNLAEQLSIHVYETEHVPTNRGEVTVLHPSSAARYEVATVQKVDGIIVDGYTIDQNEYSAAYVGRGTNIAVGGNPVFGNDESDPTTEDTQAILVIEKVQTNGGEYKVSIFEDDSGDHYKAGDVITVLGGQLGGTNGVNDATITVTEVITSAINKQNNIETGKILRMSISGTPNVIAGYTPQRSGQVYKLNFSTSNDEFDNDGLAAIVPIGEYVSIRQNSTHIFREVESIDTLTIRPSTAVNFQDDEEDTYRSISFGRNDAVGTTLFDDQTSCGFDAGWDFIRMVVAPDHIGRAGTDISPAAGSTTLGDTAGDTTIAIDLIPEIRDQWRLNNNLETESAYKPPFTNNDGRELEYSAELPKVIDWKGKKHYVYNYREVEYNAGTGKYDETVIFGEANSFALVDLKAISEVTLTLDHGATWNRLATYNGELENVVVRQIGNTSAYGKVKIAGDNSTEMVLYDWSGNNFNTSGQLEISVDCAASDYGTFANCTWTSMVDAIFESVAVVPTSQNVRDTNLTAQAGDGLADTLDLGTNETNILRAGLQDGSPAKITIQISTCRATGHDFLDIGTGSYNQTNYPNVVLGFPATEPDQGKEVQERNKGRVFYMSTDQDGFFRVGRFFTVDQGTGTVTFAASIALSDVDGIGFKRGVVVSEFSSDTSMADNAIDAVPTESAVRGYVSRRLGYDQAGNVVTNPLGPSVLTQNGAVPLTGDLSAGGNTITNIAPVDLDDSGARDAVPREYVDSRAEAFNKAVDLRDTSITGDPDNEILGFSKTKVMYVRSNPDSPNWSAGRQLTNGGGTADYGIIKGNRTKYDPAFGDITIITFEPGADTFNTVNAYSFSGGGIGSIQGVDIYEQANGVPPGNAGGSGEVINGPYDEVINISEEPFQAGVPTSDIGFTTRRLQDDDTFNSFRGAYDAATTYSAGNIVEYESSLYQYNNPTDAAGNLPTDTNYWNTYTDTVREEPTAYINFQINDEVIVNQDVNPDAGILQSKLLLQDADAFVTDVNDIEVIPAAEVEAGILYEIVAAGTVNFVNAFGASDSNVGTQFTASQDGITAAVAGGNATVKRVLTPFQIGSLVNDDQRNNQAELGLSKFDGANFKVTRGHVQIKDNGITLDKIEKLASDTVIGNSTGSEANCAEVTFVTVVDEGGGVRHVDIKSTDVDQALADNQTGTGVITRTASETYTTIPETTIGTKNSFVKTDSTGRVTVKTLAIGQDASQDVLKAVDLTASGTSNGLQFLTPQQGIVLEAQYDTNSDNPIVNSPASWNFGGLLDDTDPFAQSTLQAAGSLDNASWVASSWAYHAFIEAPGEKGDATTGIAIGTGSGEASNGQIAIVVADAANDTSVQPVKFSNTGFTPDVNSNGTLGYDIGGSSNYYKNLYSYGAYIGGTGITSSGNIDTSGSATISAGGDLSAGGTLTVTSSATFGGGYGSTGVTISAAGAISMNSSLTIDGNIIAGSSNQDIGSSGSPFRDIYGSTFSGTAAQAKFADLAENYVADADYEPGTVLVFGGTAEVTTTDSKADHRVAGVVSTDPAYLMNSHQEGEHVASIALQGRVPCKVIGTVKKGDLLVTSAIPGYAIVWNNPGKVGVVIGKALEDKETSDRGIIEVVVGRV
jgi:hypothetical protein